MLARIREGSIVRFRCQSGHAHTLNTLLAGVDASILALLRESVRALEERARLLRELGELEAHAAGELAASRSMLLAASSDQHAQALGTMALDPQLAVAPEHEPEIESLSSS